MGHLLCHVRAEPHWTVLNECQRNHTDYKPGKDGVGESGEPRGEPSTSQKGCLDLPDANYNKSLMDTKK